ncbi:MAG: hypothetical protein WCS88_01075 [Patescibacteria group bacterium]|jgi:hypothetical protein
MIKNNQGFSDAISMTIVCGILGALFITGVFVWKETELFRANQFINKIFNIELKADTKDEAKTIILNEGQHDIVLDATDQTYILADSKTELVLKRVHTIYELGGENGAYGPNNIFEEKGLPYLKIDDAWLEIFNDAEIYSNGYNIKLKNNGCAILEKFQEDYSYNYIDSCNISVDIKKDEADYILPKATEHTFSFDTRYDGFLIKNNYDNFVAIRETGFYVGNIDNSKNPPEPTSLRAGLDIITNFGVKNIEFDLFDEKVLNRVDSIIIGPLKISYSIKDVGNSNTHCYTGSCINIFVIELKSEVIDDKYSEVKIISPASLLEEPTNEELLLEAIKSNDKQLCNNILDLDKELCINVFEDKCDVYSDINLESCEYFKTILDNSIVIDNTTVCLPEQRNADACVFIYDPVCASVNVECITAPCPPIKQTFSNSCEACRNSRVIDYIKGEC